MGKDPAFLFYDGDAARDVSHMNRLERGCYFDFIQAQKKFGPLSLNVIKKILGHDFSSCWESLKICLTYDNDMYYITWLKDSIEKRQKYSESRSKNKKGTKSLKHNNIQKSYVEHMENEIVIENENTIEVKIASAFDELMMESIRSTFPKHDLKNELSIFLLKVRGSPDKYRYHEVNGLRQAFIYQLKNSTSTNGTRNGTKTDIRRADATIESGADFGQL